MAWPDSDFLLRFRRIMSGSQCLPQIVLRHRSGDVYPFSADRMREFYASRHKRYASVGIASLVAIFEVAFYRTAYGRQLHSDLVLAAGEQIDFEQMVAVRRGYMPLCKYGFL